MLATSPFEKLKLRHYPALKQGRAYNSADCLLVEAALASGVAGDKTLVLNDEFGALCVSLEPAGLWTDSYLSKLSLEYNLALNEAAPVRVGWSTDDLPSLVPADACDAVIIRVPKQLAYFQFQLSQLSRYLPVGTPVLAAGMDKHLTPGTAELLERYIGPTVRHRGQRKARLFSAVRDNRCVEPFSDTTAYFSAALHGKLISLPNVFAREKMDIGSRFLLEHLGKLKPVDWAIDLACGNGLMGLTALSQGLCRKLLLCDESAMAIASARSNTQATFPEGDINFHHGDGLLNYAGPPVELIICNPPFHLNHTMDETVGRRLLVQAAGKLTKGGSLCMVANRHLNYLPILKREFTRVEKLAQNNKFIIWQATL